MSAVGHSSGRDYRPEIVERALDQGVGRLYEAWQRQDLIRDELLAASQVRPGLPLSMTLEGYLRDEVDALPESSDYKKLVLDLARATAKVAQCQEPNDRVCARYAVESAWFALCAGSVRAPYHEPWPHTWRAGRPYRLASGGRWEREHNVSLPLNREALAALRRHTTQVASALKRGVIDDCGLGVRPGWALLSDVARPPLQGLRHLVDLLFRPLERKLLERDKELRIWLLEAGHSTAAQAISHLLPKSTILPRVTWVDCPVLDHVQGHVVVVNVPDHITELQVQALASVEPITYRDMLALREQRPSNRHIAPLLRAARRLLRPRGILVVIGATTAGEHHEAVRQVEGMQDMQPLVLQGTDTSRDPVWARYTCDFYAPYGLVPPTDRLISVWRRC